jgi:hypothetical protein
MVEKDFSFFLIFFLSLGDMIIAFNGSYRLAPSFPPTEWPGGEDDGRGIPAGKDPPGSIRCLSAKGGGIEGLP